MISNKDQTDLDSTQNAIVAQNSTSTLLIQLVKKEKEKEKESENGEISLIPKRATSGSAGLDLCSSEFIVIPAKSRSLVKTGLKIKVPKGTYGRVAPRSGLALKEIDVAAGVIDEDYRGEVGVVLVNNSSKAYTVQPGQRIAQLIIEKIEIPEVVIVDDIGITDEAENKERGSNGFGSTGL